MHEHQDVIVIGAGAAGLAAAASLGRAGHSVLLLEARDRIGGRICSRREPGLAVPIELGAEFIHGDSPETHDWLRTAGAAAIDTSGEHWSLIGGRLQRRTESLLGQVRAALESADVLSKPDTSLEAFLTGDGGRTLSDEARSMARAFVSGFDAADPERVSIQSVADEWRAGGMLDASQSRPLGGYGSLLLALGAALDPARVHVRLQSIVTDVRWGSDAPELQAAYVHNWTRDPHARGAYSYVAIGGGNARELLAAPVDGTLFFAGEATDTTGDPATVTGALRSGARAALEVDRLLEGRP